MKFKRLTKKGYKIRRTRRINQVKTKISALNIGGKDAGNLLNLLTQKVQTKAGIKRSKRLEQLIFSEESKGLKRFKEFRDLDILSPKTKLSSIIRQLQFDADFYNKNRDLISEYNTLSKEERKNRRLKIVQDMDREWAKFMKTQNIF